MGIGRRIRFTRPSRKWNISAAGGGTLALSEQWHWPKWHPSEAAIHPGNGVEAGAGAGALDLSRICQTGVRLWTIAGSSNKNTATENSFPGDPTLSLSSCILNSTKQQTTNNFALGKTNGEGSQKSRANSTCVQLIIVKKSKSISNSMDAAPGVEQVMGI